MEWKWSTHVIRQMKERNIDRETVVSALASPDESMTGMRDRRIFHKLLGRKLLRVVTENDVIVTVYMTGKVDKYLQRRRQ